MPLIDAVRRAVRNVMRAVAGGLNRISRGRLTPNTVTLIGVAMHLPIAVLIALGSYSDFLAAGLLLLVFGLFDTLDGELARLQGSASPRGMLLDASTDRIKEVLLYSGAAYYLSGGAHPRYAVLAVVACGASLTVSYVKAKGEAAVAAGGSHISHDALNRLFKDGLLTFELRMLLLIIGLLAQQLAVALGIIALLASYTAVQRLATIMSKLKSHAGH